MERPERRTLRGVAALSALLPLVSGVTYAAAPAADALETAKSDIRLKKFSAAASELQRLATSGNPDAQYLLAVFYLNGLNGVRDVAARGWLEKAAAQGNVRAASGLAALAADSASSVELPSPGDLRDARTRSEALWLAAERGDLRSLQVLAVRPFIDPRDEFGRGALARAALAGKTGRPRVSDPPGCRHRCARPAWHYTTHVGGARRKSRRGDGFPRGACQPQRRGSER